jgi:hypothetical protein
VQGKVEGSPRRAPRKHRQVRDAVELLRQRNADLESLRAEVRGVEVQAFGSRVPLCRATEAREILEAEVKSLSLNPKCEEMPPTHADSPLFLPVRIKVCVHFVIMWSCMLTHLGILDPLKSRAKNRN